MTPSGFRSFVSTISQPFEEDPVCPELRNLELPEEVLTYDPSFLKCALEKRVALGGRFKQMGPAVKGRGCGHEGNHL